eukprot:jgi/Galph1/4271/GphlegSOOS_G2945.1
MVYLQEWDAFITSVEALFTINPHKTRYSIKYKRKENQVVLKVTDDKECFQYVINQRSELKKLETFNAWFLSRTSALKAADCKFET